MEKRIIKIKDFKEKQLLKNLEELKILIEEIHSYIIQNQCEIIEHTREEIIDMILSIIEEYEGDNVI